MIIASCNWLFNLFKIPKLEKIYALLSKPNALFHMERYYTHGRYYRYAKNQCCQKIKNFCNELLKKKSLH